VLAHLVTSAFEVEVRYLWRPNLKDEGDNFIMEIAVAAWPCTIVTCAYVNLWELKNDPATALVSALHKAIEPKSYRAHCAGRKLGA
jgi:hypothetical protein